MMKRMFSLKEGVKKEIIDDVTILHGISIIRKFSDILNCSL